MNRTTMFGLSIVTFFVLACGGAADSGRLAEPTIDYGGGPPKRARRGGMNVSGIMGTINTNRIQEIFELRLLRFERCFTEREREIAFIGGRIEFYFRVDLDGRVVWVNPKSSTIGDRQTERCLMDIVKRTRFPVPRGGGEAEVAWSFEREPNPEVQLPVEADEYSMVSFISENAESLSACNVGTSSITVNAYIAPGGTIMSAGASISGREPADEMMLDCVTDAVAGWVMPDPGVTASKFSFNLPWIGPSTDSFVTDSHFEQSRLEGPVSLE
jgi:hypothetical protein